MDRDKLKKANKIDHDLRNLDDLYAVITSPHIFIKKFYRPKLVILQNCYGTAKEFYPSEDMDKEIKALLLDYYKKKHAELTKEMEEL